MIDVNDTGRAQANGRLKITFTAGLDADQTSIDISTLPFAPTDLLAMRTGGAYAACDYEAFFPPGSFARESPAAGASYWFAYGDANCTLTLAAPSGVVRPALTTPPLDARLASDGLDAASAPYIVAPGLREQACANGTGAAGATFSALGFAAAGCGGARAAHNAYCAANADACMLRNSSVAGADAANPLAQWCKGAATAGGVRRASTFASAAGLTRGASAAYVGALRSLSYEEQGARGCNDLPATTVQDFGDGSHEQAYRTAMCNFSQSAQYSGTWTAGSAAVPSARAPGVSVRRSHGANDNTQRRGDRALSIFTRASAGQFVSDASCSQVAPIDFVLADESVHSSCAATNLDGSSGGNVRNHGPAAIDTDLWVCLGNADQSDYLPENDRFDDVYGLYMSSRKIRFETYNVQQGIASPAVTTFAPSNQMVESNATSREVCVKFTSLTNAPACDGDGENCGSTVDWSFGCASTGAASADTIKRLGGPQNSAYTPNPSMRAAFCSVSDAAGLAVDLNLDADAAGLVNSTYATCDYDAGAGSPGGNALTVTSNLGIRLRADCGFQKQVAVRIATFSKFGSMTFDADSQVEGMALPVGAVVERTAVRGALTMVALQPYTDGAWRSAAPTDLVDALPYSEGQQDAASSDVAQPRTSVVAPVYFGAWAPVWQDSASPLSVHDAVASGNLARDQFGADGSFVLADTTQVGIMITEETACTGGVTPSAIEQTLFEQATDCDGAAVSSGKVGRARFKATYAPAGGGAAVEVRLAPTEYDCGRSAYYQVALGDFARLGSARDTQNAGATAVAEHDTWADVMSQLVASLQVQVAMDYSTQMCADLTYSASLTVRDVRSCGYSRAELAPGGLSFLRFTVRTAPPLPGNYRSVVLNVTGPAGADYATELAGAGAITQMAIALDGAKDSAQCTTASRPFVPGCSSGSVAGGSEGAGACRYSVEGYDANKRDQQGQYAFAQGARDLDFVASLEVTDLTNAVQPIPLHSESAENKLFYSQIRGLIGADASRIAPLASLPVVGGAAASQYEWNPDAVFVATRSFLAPHGGASSDGSATEGHATAANQSFAYQSLASQGLVPPTAAVADGLAAAYATRYSIFGSVDAFAIAVGLDLDVAQKCVPCSDIAGAIAALAPGHPLGALAAANAETFKGECRRSRAALLPAATPLADGCPASPSDWDFRRVVVYNQALVLATHAMPAMNPRVLWRDPLRMHMALVSYDWINAHTLAASLSGSVLPNIAERGSSAFTLQPTCAPDVALVDTACGLSFADASAIAIQEDAAGGTGDGLRIGLAPAPVHLDGVCSLRMNADHYAQDTTWSHAVSEFELRRYNATFTRVYEQTAAGLIKQCATTSEEPPCGANYTCVPRAFRAVASPTSGARVQPADSTDARVTATHLLADLDSVYTARAETLGAGDRCGLHAWSAGGAARCVLNATKQPAECHDAADIHATYLADDFSMRHSFVNQYSACASSGDAWKYAANAADGASVSHAFCGGSTVADSLGAYTSARRALEHTLFPAGAASAALSNDVPANLGVFAPLVCSSLASPVLTPEWTSRYSAPVLTFSKDFTTQVRTPGGCDAPVHTKPAYGVQLQMVSESVPRPAYGGGNVAVSSCKLLPGSGRAVEVQALFDASHHAIANATVATAKQLAAPNSSQTYWNETGRPLYELNRFNAQYNLVPANGSAAGARSDGMAANVGGGFASPVLFGDVRPVAMHVDVRAGGHRVNDLFRVYSAFTGGQAAPAGLLQVHNWTADADGHSLDVTHAAIAGAAYSPTAVDVAALSASFCDFQFEHSAHAPGLQASSFGFDEAARAQCRRVVLMPLVRNLGFGELAVTLSVTAEDAASTRRTVSSTMAVPVVNVAGAPGIAYAPSLLKQVGYYVRSGDDVLSQPADSVALLPHFDGAGADGASMAGLTHATLAKSTLGGVPHFYPLPVQVWSDTFSHADHFTVNGVFSEAAIGQSGLKAHTISCDKNTTCNMYNESAYLSICASQDILVGRKIDGGAGSSNYTLFQALDAVEGQEGQEALICGWANSSGTAPAAVQGAATADLAVSSALASPADAITVGAPAPRGGRLYRVKIAETEVVCNGDETECSVGYHVGGAAGAQLNNLVYGVGADVSQSLSLGLQAFVTTFTDVGSERSIAIDDRGNRLRSQQIQWRARVYTTSEVGGICMDTVVLPTGAGEQAHKVNFYDDGSGSAGFGARGWDYISAKTPIELYQQLPGNASGVSYNDASEALGITLGSVHDIDRGASAGAFDPFSVTMTDSTSDRSGSAWIDVLVTRVVPVVSDGQTFGQAQDALAEDLAGGTALNCTTMASDTGRCQDQHSPGVNADWPSNLVSIKLGESNGGEQVAVRVPKPSGYDSSAPDQDLLVCFSVSQRSGSLNVVQQCRERCVLWMDSDASGQVDCQPNACGGGVGDVAGATLAQVTCEMSMSANHTLRKSVAELHLPSSAGGALNVTNAPGDLATVTTVEESNYSRGANGTDVAIEFAASHAGQYADLIPLAHVYNASAKTWRIVSGAEHSVVATKSPCAGGACGGPYARVTALLRVAPGAPVDRLGSGEQCGAAETMGGVCPAYTANVSVPGTAGVCRSFRSAFALGANEARYAPGRARVCYGNETAGGCLRPNLRSVAYSPSAGSGATTATTAWETSAIGLVVGAADGIGAFATDDAAPCSGGPAAQMRGAVQTCTRFDGTRVAGRSGHYTVPLSTLFYKNATGACVRGPGVTLAVARAPTAAAVTFAGPVVQGHGLSTNLSDHMPSTVNSSGILQATVSGGAVTVRVAAEAAAYACDVGMSEKIMQITATGEFGLAGAGPGDIALLFAPVDMSGSIELQSGVAADADGGALFPANYTVSRSSTDSTLYRRTEQFLGQQAGWDGAVGRAVGVPATSLREVWVQLKVCAQRLVADGFGFRLNNAPMVNLQNGTNLMLRDQDDASTVCASRYVHIPQGTSSVPLELTLDRANASMPTCAGGCVQQALHATLCMDGMSGCYVFEQEPSAALLRLAEHARSPSLAPSTVGTALDYDGGIVCQSTGAVCGASWSTAGCAAPETRVSFMPEEAPWTYTLFMLAPAEGAQQAPQPGVALVEVTPDSAEAAQYVVASSSPGVCLSLDLVDVSNGYNTRAADVTGNLTAADIGAKLGCSVSAPLLAGLVAAHGSACARVAVFAVDPDVDRVPVKVAIAVSPREGLLTTAVDYLYVAPACADGACATQIPAGRIAVIQRPSSAPVAEGATADAVSRLFGMGFSDVGLDSASNEVVLNFQWNYRPSHVDGQTGACWNNASLGQDAPDGYSYGAGGDTAQCANWGAADVRGQGGRGYSAALMTIGIGSDVRVNASDRASPAFDPHFEDDFFCSPMRGLKARLGEADVSTVGQLADALFVGNASYRAQCDQLGEGPYAAAGSAALAPVLGSAMPFAYSKAGAGSQPRWDFRVAHNRTAAGSLQPVCASRYVVQGQLRATLTNVGQCMSMTQGAAPARAPAVSVNTYNAGEGDELAVVTWPVCMQKFSAVKGRASGSVASLVHEEACVDVRVQTRTTLAYTSTETSLGRSVDLPSMYTESVELVTDSAAGSTEGDVSVQGGNFVNTACFDQCRKTAATCAGACVDSCTIAIYPTDSTVGSGYIPSSFGHIEMAAVVESVAGSQDDLLRSPYVSAARAFADSESTAGAGAWNVDRVEVVPSPQDPSCRAKRMSDATHSYIKVFSKTKRIIDVADPAANFALVSHAMTIDGVAHVKQVYAASSGSKLRARTNAFSETNDQCPPSQWHAVEPGFGLSQGTFARGTDYAFQVRSSSCHAIAQDGAGCFDPVAHPLQCGVGGEFRTVRLDLVYKVQQTYVNPVTLESLVRAESYQGMFMYDGTDDFSFASEDAAKAWAAGSFVDGSSSQLVAGVPVQVQTEVYAPDSIGLGDYFRLQSKQVVLATDVVPCQLRDEVPGVPVCAAGFTNGKCGALLDQSDRTPTAHALADVVLVSPADSASCAVPPGTTPPRSTLTCILTRSNAWYMTLASTVVNNALTGTFSGASQYKLCVGATMQGDSASPNLVLASKISLWCPEDHVVSVWDGTSALEGFLKQVNEQTCSSQNSFWLVSTGTTSYAYKQDVVTSTKYAGKACVGGTTSAQRSQFIRAFNTLEVVSDYDYQKVAVRQANFLPMSDLGSQNCLRVSSLTDANRASFQAVAQDAAAQCGDLARVISTNAETGYVMQQATRAGIARPVVAGGAYTEQEASRHAQCSSATKSIAFPFTGERGRAISHRSGLRTSLYMGSSVARPCEGKRMFSLSVITDTRRADVCEQASIECRPDGKVYAKGLSRAVSRYGDSWTPDPSTLYPLWRRTDLGTNVAGSPGPAIEDVQDINGAAANIEGVMLGVGPSDAKHLFIYAEKPRAEGTYNGMRWSTGRLEYFRASSQGDVDSLDLANGALVFVEPPSAAASYSGNARLQQMTCGSDGSSDLLLDGAMGTALVMNFANISMAGNGAAPAARRSALPPVLRVRTSGAGAAASEFSFATGAAPPGAGSRRSTPDTLLTTVTYIAPGAYEIETCANTGNQAASCTVVNGYVPRVGGEARMCGQGEGGQCSFDYCCERVAEVNIHNYYVSATCADLRSTETHMMIAWIIAFGTGALLALVLLVNFAFLLIAGRVAPRSALATESSSGKKGRVVMLIMTILLNLAAAVLAGIGLRSEGWVHECIVGETSWAIWLPLLILVLAGVRVVFYLASVGGGSAVDMVSRSSQPHRLALGRDGAAGTVSAEMRRADRLV